MTAAEHQRAVDLLVTERHRLRDLLETNRRAIIDALAEQGKHAAQP